MSHKKWQLYPAITAEERENFPELQPIVSQLLINRNLRRQEQIDEFFNPDYSQDIYDPFLFKEMKKSVERVKAAVKKNQKIVVYGDYDADGVTSTVVMVSALKKIGAKQVDVYIPHRLTEGYGLSLSALKAICKKKVDLIITVDCGISNYAEAVFAREQGIDLIIVDHHHAPEKLPPAYSILCNTVVKENYPFKELAGVGMAFKFVQGLLLKCGGEDGHLQAFEKWLLDLVAIGTIGDCVTLLGENRTLVKYGLMVLNKTKRVGLKKLIAIARIKAVENDDMPAVANRLYNLKSDQVSFQLVPRLNAAGRIDHANVAYQLLMTSNSEEAELLAQELNHANQERQRVVEKIVEECRQQIKTQQKNKILICSGQDWSIGLVGLVAGKLSDEYYKPVLVFGQQGENFSASGRSIKEFNMIEAVEELKQYLKQYGGHEQACGLKIEGLTNFEQFCQKIIKKAAKILKDVELVPTIKAEACLQLDEVDWNLQAELVKFEPFGEDNPRPLFWLKDLEIVNLSRVGADQKHLRLDVRSSSRTQKKLICFGLAENWADILAIGDQIEAMVEIGINDWRGKQELQLKALDLRKVSS